MCVYIYNIYTVYAIIIYKGELSKENDFFVLEYLV